MTIGMKLLCLPELLVPPLLVKTQKEKNHIGEMPKISQIRACLSLMGQLLARTAI